MSWPVLSPKNVEWLDLEHLARGVVGQQRSSGVAALAGTGAAVQPLENTSEVCVVLLREPRMDRVATSRAFEPAFILRQSLLLLLNEIQHGAQAFVAHDFTLMRVREFVEFSVLASRSSLRFHGARTVSPTYTSRAFSKMEMSGSDRDGLTLRRQKLLPNRMSTV